MNNNMVEQMKVEKKLVNECGLVEKMPAFTFRRGRLGAVQARRRCSHVSEQQHKSCLFIREQKLQVLRQ